MSFFRNLKNILTTGSRHPSAGGASGDRHAERPIDNIDGLASAPKESLDGMSNVPTTVPPNYVPSQQDDRPHH